MVISLPRDPLTDMTDARRVVGCWPSFSTLRLKYS